MEIINFEKGISKGRISLAAQQTVEKVRNGEIDPLKTYIQAKAYQGYFTEIVKNTQSDAIAEIEKYGKDDRVLSCKVELSNTGERLDYEKDPVYADLKKQLKERENELKTAFKSKNTMVDENGEVIPKVPVKTPSYQTPKITIPNE